jgi:hypothetical protein
MLIDYPWKSPTISYPWGMVQRGTGTHAGKKNRHSKGAQAGKGGQFAAKDVPKNVPMTVQIALGSFKAMNRNRSRLNKAKARLKKDPENKSLQFKVKNLSQEYNLTKASFKEVQAAARAEGFQVNALGKWTNKKKWEEAQAAPDPAKIIGYKPKGPSIKEKLKLPRRNKLNGLIHDAAEAIDKVHGDGVLPEIWVKHVQISGALGDFLREHVPKVKSRVIRDIDGNLVKPPRIRIHTKGDHKGLTTAHEIGHALDYFGITKTSQNYIKTTGRQLISPITGSRHATPEATLLSRKPPPVLTGLMKAIDKSPSVARLQDMRRNPGKYTVTTTNEDDWGAFSVSYEVDRKFIKYLDRPVEKFARAYSQYIVVRSKHPTLMAELRVQQERGKKGRITYPKHWEDAEFEPIAAEFDKAFAELGWMEPIYE